MRTARGFLDVRVQLQYNNMQQIEYRSADNQTRASVGLLEEDEEGGDDVEKLIILNGRAMLFIQHRNVGEESCGGYTTLRQHNRERVPQRRTHIMDIKVKGIPTHAPGQKVKFIIHIFFISSVFFCHPPSRDIIYKI